MRHAGVLGPAIGALMEQDPARRWDMEMSAKPLGDIARGIGTAVMSLGDRFAVDFVADTRTRRLEAQPHIKPWRLDVAARTMPVRLPEGGPALDVTALAVHSEPPVSGDPHCGALVPPPEGHRSGGRWLLLVALLVVLIALAYPLGRLEGRGASSALPGANSRTAPANTTATSASTAAPVPSKDPVRPLAELPPQPRLRPLP
jgi:hypothetical protein